MQGIEGTQELIITLRFGVPPGTDATKAAQQILSGGLSVSLGLIQYLKGSDCNVVDVAVGPKLHTP